MPFKSPVSSDSTFVTFREIAMFIINFILKSLWNVTLKITTSLQKNTLKGLLNIQLLWRVFLEFREDERIYSKAEHSKLVLFRFHLLSQHKNTFRKTFFWKNDYESKDYGKDQFTSQNAHFFEIRNLYTDQNTKVPVEKLNWWPRIWDKTNPSTNWDWNTCLKCKSASKASLKCKFNQRNSFLVEEFSVIFCLGALTARL